MSAPVHPTRPELHSAGSVGEWKGPQVNIWTDQLCQKCGHAPCPCCGDWCDSIVYTDADGNELTDEQVDAGGCDAPGVTSDTCCDMECTYAEVPRFFVADGSEWDPCARSGKAT